MGISSHIEKVYQRALALRQQANGSPIQPELLDTALQELYFVLEELQAADEEVQQQNQALIATHQTLEIERQRYLTLFELAPDGYLVTDRHGLIRQANRAAAVLCGVPQDYLTHKPLILFITEEDRPSFQARLANPGAAQDWEITLTRRDQPTITVAISVAMLQNPQGEAHALLWLLRDITPRKQMEAQLQAARDHLEQQVATRTAALTSVNTQLRQTLDDYHQAEAHIQYQAALIDQVSDAIYVQDLQGLVEFWSPGAERLYGWPPEVVLGKPTTDLWQEDGKALGAQADLLQPAADFWQGELSQQTHSGQPLTVLSRRTQLYSSTGQPRAMLVVNTDITHLKQLEAQIYQSQRLESLGTLASGLAHDLNNALTPVITAAEMLLLPAQALEPPACDLARLIKTSGQRSVDLIQQLLLFAQGTHAQRLPLWLRQPLLEVIALLRPTLPSTVDLVLQIPPDWPYRVLANPTQLQQVLMNLCLNACEAMPQGGTLTLSVADHLIDPAAITAYVGAQPGHYGVITVTDTGTGMAPSLVERIFDPFFTTKPHGQGTGLGLSTVFSLVKHHNGFLQVESQVGVGTEFRVYLPILDSLVLAVNSLAHSNHGANCPPDAVKNSYDSDQS